MHMNLDLSFLLQGQYASMLLVGLRTTLTLFILSALLGMAIAIVIVVLRSIPFKPLNALIAAFVEYHRDVPTVVQILVWFFGVPQILPPAVKAYVNSGQTELMFATIALALNVSAYWSNDIRSGLKAIPAAQFEAARSVGLGFFQAMRYVMLPQALRISVPPLLNRSLILFKDTSLAMVIGVTELTYQIKSIDNLTFRTFDVLALATIVYLICSLTIMFLGRCFERRFPSAYRG
ncbi:MULTISPECIES: amino acid ABC transporter permease [Achromobacter]|uniref:amino acid ABC transporter permease n=1 Tax=Achromobacter sp. TaxID=134375 RepID=UPI002F926CEA